MGVPQHKHTGCCLVLTLILRRGLVRFHKVQALPYISNALLVQRVFSDVQMVAEFAIRYALDVHRAWAAGGLAPRLLHTEVSNSPFAAGHYGVAARDLPHLGSADTDGS